MNMNELLRKKEISKKIQLQKIATSNQVIQKKITLSLNYKIMIISNFIIKYYKKPCYNY